MSLFTKFRSGAVALLAALAAFVFTLPASAPPVLVAAGGGFVVGASVAPTAAQAALTFSTSARNDMMTAVNALLSNGSIRLYNGSKPASLGTPAGTLLATLTLGPTAGTVSGGVLTVGSVTQSNGSHVNGTPTFARFSGSGGTAVADIDIGGGAGNLTFTGTVTNGQNVTITGLALTAGNN